MHRILTYGVEALATARKLPSDRYVCASTELLGTMTETAIDLVGAFGGRPPDLLLADITRQHDCLPIKHLRRVFREIWDDKPPQLPCIAMVSPNQLSLPEIFAIVEDFLIPPFSQVEAQARISRLMFKHRKVESSNSIQFFDVTLDLDAAVALNSNGCRIPLTPKEFNLLSFLCSHRGKFFSREMLVNLVWGVSFEGGERTVDIHIRRIRAKLPTQAASFLETRRGIGYGFRGVE
ncbi:winged helix-turn-helix transcriptional regulator [Fimbriimonas ginsengisoli]|nr:response regulator transcription factor [Fimbriimonas ginsengisoli]